MIVEMVCDLEYSGAVFCVLRKIPLPLLAPSPKWIFMYNGHECLYK
jgi:hypothetical protein